MHFLRWSPVFERTIMYFALTQHPPQLLEGEEWYKGEECDQTPGQQFIFAFIDEFINASDQAFAVQPSVDGMLKHAKDSHESSKHNGLV